MTSRELVRRALEFGSPPSVPRQAWVVPWAEQHYPDAVARLHSEFPDDIVTAPALYRHPLRVEGGPCLPGIYIDEWGCRFENSHAGLLGDVRDPVIRDWDHLERLRPPTEALDVDRQAVDRFCASTDRFTLAGTLVRPFERIGFLRTMEQALADVLVRSAGFTELLRRVHAHYLAEVEVWSATRVDAIVIMDDWGAQDRMLVSPALWRELFKPLYAEYCEAAHRGGKCVFMHSDGRITEIIGDLIELGVDALNCQVHCMGVGELGGRFRGRLTFWGDVDRHLLALGTPAAIAEAVREMREQLWADGGVIAQCEFGPGARPENVLEVFRAWQRLDETA